MIKAYLRLVDLCDIYACYKGELLLYVFFFLLDGDLSSYLLLLSLFSLFYIWLSFPLLELDQSYSGGLVQSFCYAPIKLIFKKMVLIMWLFVVVEKLAMF